MPLVLQPPGSEEADRMKTSKLWLVLIFPRLLPVAPAAPTVTLGQDARPSASSREAVGDTPWPRVGNDAGGMRFSSLREIHAGNVRNLEVAWTYNTRDAGDKTTIECTPIVVDGVMYLT